ncbi:spore germination protein YndE [Alicyclobacillus cellulosilyticus]|uniref:Spore germination protein YndE n=1 Tax=Alicyclobacillus cellulosilyticus TaxID=1003997 RepID=A0A917KCR7_9BACL|nr:endospore germination permease [Alicyclobacillus cellulosilyticus]GGJ06975.1 spore germination protein YndE [Alicyclobacillus cellulosilyticus]
MSVQISRVQLVSMLIWTVTATGIITLPASVAQFTVHDGWMAGVSCLLAGAITAPLASWFVRVFPGETLSGALLLTFGPWLGRGLAVWQSILLWISVSTILREASAFLGAAVLPHTAEPILTGLCMFIVAFYVAHGLEVMARVTEATTPFALVIGPLLFVLALRHFDGQEFLPILGDGWSPVLRACVVPVLVYGLETLLVLHMAPYLRKPETIGRDLLIASVIVAALMTLGITLSIAISGPAASHLQYPMLEVVRTIRLGKYLERLDTLYVMGVMATLILKLSVFHFSLCEVWRHVFALPSRRIVVYAAALSAWVGSDFLFRNVHDLGIFIIDTAPAYFAASFLGLPLLAIAAAYVRRRVSGTLPARLQ